MGIYSTRKFSRSKAISLLASAIHDPSTTDEMLGDMLDVVLKQSLHNAIVCPDWLDGEDIERS